MKEKISLSGVPETMQQTVYARARESRGRGVIRDAKAAELEAKMKAVDPATSIRVDVQARIPPLAPVDDPSLYTTLLRLLGQNQTHAVSYGTEAGIFAAAGTPSVVCGPGHIRDAHQPDESIAVEQLDRCTDFLVRLAETCKA